MERPIKILRPTKPYTFSGILTALLSVKADVYLSGALRSGLLDESAGLWHLDQPHTAEIMAVLSPPVQAVIYQTCHPLKYSSSKRQLQRVVEDRVM